MQVRQQPTGGLAQGGGGSANLKGSAEIPPPAPSRSGVSGKLADCVTASENTNE